MAKETVIPANGEVSKSVVTTIVLPKRKTVLAKITNVSDGQGAKFANPTKVISFTTLGANPTSDVMFVGLEFWKKANFDSIIFVDNAVSFICEEHIAYKTGFVETEGDETLTAHTKDDEFSFVSATHATTEQYFDAMIDKYQFDVIRYFFTSITEARARKATSVSSHGHVAEYDSRHE